MFKPSAIVLDFETALTDGTPSTEYYRPDFRAVSAALSWRGRDGSMFTLFLEGEDEIRARLERIQEIDVPVVVHNFQFEYGVLLHRFPGLESLVSVDTMRLVQVADGGGKLAHYEEKPRTYDDMLDAAENGGESTYKSGLSLVSSASRFLDAEWHNHKEPYHKVLREEFGVKKGKEGENLDKLTPQQLEDYNVADAKVTLLLYETLLAKFETEEYDWRLDHQLYSSTAKLVAAAKGIGLDVQRDDLDAYQIEIEAEIKQIGEDFRAKFQKPILELEAQMADAYVMAVKTEKARIKRRAAIEAGEVEEVRFKVGSNLQLRRLFVDKLGITPKFWTKAPKNNPKKPRKKPFVPSPSFKAAHLSTYGDGGTMLRERRKRMLVLSQAKSLLGLTRYDNRWHFDIKACGTATGRMAGGQI